MKFKPYDRNAIGVYKMTDNMEFIRNFVNSGLACAKVEDYTQKNAYICANVLNGAAKRLLCPHVKAITKKGEVYLINELIEE